MVQHNRDFYSLLRSGVPVEYQDAQGRQKSARARVIDFDNAPGSNRFVAVREMKLTGTRRRTTTAAPIWSASSTACRWCSSS